MHDQKFNAGPKIRPQLLGNLPCTCVSRLNQLTYSKIDLPPRRFRGRGRLGDIALGDELLNSLFSNLRGVSQRFCCAIPAALPMTEQTPAPTITPTP
jgi:hypothetical protein